MRNRIGYAIGSNEDLLISARNGKLRWYGHIITSTGLEKMISQGTVPGGRRQKKRWEDNIIN